MNNKISLIATLLAITLSVSCLTACGSSDNHSTHESRHGYSTPDGYHGCVKNGDKPGGFTKGTGTTDEETSITDEETDYDIANIEIDGMNITDIVGSNYTAKNFMAAARNYNTDWELFTEMIEQAKKSEMNLPTWFMNTYNRVKVVVKNNSGVAIQNEKISLCDKDDNIIWTSVTNKDGIAYLFDTDANIANKVVASDGTESTLKNADAGTSREVQLIIDKESSVYSTVQVLAVAEQSESMLDELVYLWDGLKDEDSTLFAKNTQIGLQGITQNAQLVDCCDLAYGTKNIARGLYDCIDEIHSESSDSGDESSDEMLSSWIPYALDSSLNGTKWSDDAVKVAVVLLNTPVKDDEKSSAILDKAIKKASEQGIHIISVVQDGSDFRTELLGATLATKTDGVFIEIADENENATYCTDTLHDSLIKTISSYDQTDCSSIEYTE